MSKAVKIGAGVIGILVLLFLVAIVLLVTLVNPNNYKQQISNAVQQATGRQLTIAGDIKWSFFPWLGVKLNQISLSNAPGFEPQNFAELSQADVNILVLPLFVGKVEVGTVTLNDLIVHLAKNKQGLTNWNLLLQNKSKNSSSTSTSPTIGLNSRTVGAGLLVSNIDLSNATVTWQDQQKGQSLVADNIDLQSSQFSFGKAFPMKLKFHLLSKNPKLETTVAIAADVMIDSSLQKAALQQLTINGELIGNKYPSGSVPFTLNADVNADLQQQTMQITNGNFSIANLKGNVVLAGTKISSAPLLQGTISIPTFNLKNFLIALGGKSNAKDPAAMQTAALKTNIDFSPKILKLQGLHATVDDTTIDGNINLNQVNDSVFSFNLKINELNLDRYASPTSTSSANNISPGASSTAAANTSTSSAPALLPLALLRQYSGNGSLQIDKLITNNLSFTNINTHITANNGLISLAPITANLYQGNSHGSIRLNARSNVPTLSLHETLTYIQVEPLFNDMAKNSKIKLTGTGNLSMNLNTQGNDSKTMTRQLNGNIKFSIENGAIKNIDVKQAIFAAIAHVLKQNTPNSNADSNNQTSFSSLTGTANIVNGIVNNNDLLLRSTALQVNGSGNANLINQTINYSLKTKAIGDPFGKDIFNLQDQIGGSIPMTVSGSFANPSIQPDFALIATALLKGQAQQQLNKVLPQIEKNLPQNLNDTIKGLRNILGQ